jgi:hypothetical protein
MSEAPDPLEAELSSLRPHEISPGLRRRVAERLADVPSEQRRRLWWYAVAGGLAAACVAALLLWRGGGKGIEPEHAHRQPAPEPRRQPLPRPAPPVDAAASGPTLLACQRALARSPEELDAFLNRHAGVPAELHPELMRVSAFTRSEAILHNLLGDD